jgi:hypothetical protein
MRVNDDVPPIGTAFDWDIDEIMERRTGDMRGYYWTFCTRCGLAHDEDGDPAGDVERPCIMDGLVCTLEPNVNRSWDCLIEDKEIETNLLDDLEQSILEDGFVIPLSATIDPDDGHLVLGDGHHRLIVAIGLGHATVPVVVRAYHEHISADSGHDWEYGDPIPTEFVSRAEARRLTLVG